jgi:hypothetical protein
MRKVLARRPSPAMVVACVSLFVALSGVSYAVSKVAKNSVGSAQIKKGAVNSSDIRNNSVASTDLRNNSVASIDLRNDGVAGADVLESSLGTVPSATKAITADSANTAKTADVANGVAESEPFHEVGAPGEPAFENGWKNRSSDTPLYTLETAGFYKDREGVVHLKGILDTEDATGAVIFRLPPGYRPAEKKALGYPPGASETPRVVVVMGSGIDPVYDGVVVMNQFPPGDSSVFLDGITFRAGS